MAEFKLAQKFKNAINFEINFKRVLTHLVLLSFIHQNLAFATQSIIELDFKDSAPSHRLQVIPRLSTISDVDHVEIDTDNQQVAVYRQEPQTDQAEELQEGLEGSEGAPRLLNPILIPQHDVHNLPWDLEPEKLTLFILQQTAWLTPLDEDGYKLEFRSGLLGGMFKSGGEKKELVIDVTKFYVDCKGRNDFPSGTVGEKFCNKGGNGSGGSGVQVINAPGTGGGGSFKGNSSGWQSVLGKGWAEIEANGDQARERMQKQQENLKKLSTVGQPVEIYKRKDIIIPVNNPLLRIQPPQPSLPFPKDWDSKVDRIDRGMTRLSWCEMYYLGRAIGVPDDVITDWKNNRASNKVKLSDYLATKKKIELEKAKKEEEATKKKLQAIKEEQIKVELERSKIQKMSSPDEYDRYYIETALLPHILKMVGPSYYPAYKDYKTFITVDGTGYKLGRDINEYWQSWLNSKTWGETAKKNPLPTYKLPIHLVRDQRTFDRHFIETTLLPHIRKYTSHSGYKDYQSFVKEPGTNYHEGDDIQAYMNLPSWQTWQGGAAKDFPKYQVPETCNPFYGDYEKLTRVQTMINTASWEAVYDYAGKQGLTKEDVQYVNSRRTETITFDGYMKEVFDDQVLEDWGAYDLNVIPVGKMQKTDPMSPYDFFDLDGKMGGVGMMGGGSGGGKLGWKRLFANQKKLSEQQMKTANNVIQKIQHRTRLQLQEKGILDAKGKLTPKAIETAKPIEKLKIENPKVIKELTKDGSKIEDWNKVATKEGIILPNGNKAKVHFYKNTKTGKVNTELDFKLKGEVPLDKGYEMFDIGV